jgi:hypothetical protein
MTLQFLYVGPLCAVCADGFTFQSSTQRCEPCTNSYRFDVYATAFLFICVLLVGITCWYSIRRIKVLGREIRQADDVILFVCLKLGLLRASGHSASFDTLKPDAQTIFQRFSIRAKIYVSLWQIGSLVPFALDLQFPDVYAWIVSALKVLDLSISKASFISCSSEGYNAIDALVIDTTSPIIIATLMWIVSAIHVKVASSYPSQDKEKAVRSLRSSYFAAFRIYTYLILPQRSTQIFSVFSCKNVDPDEVNEGDDSYMTADYSVSCSSEKYQFGRAWAIAMIFLYPVGIPLFYFCLLYRSRKDIQTRDNPSLSAEQSALLSQRTDSIKSLFQPYKPHLWYWEVVETISRLMLTGVLMLIAQGSAGQIIVGMIFAVASMLIHNYFEPYIDSNLQVAKYISYWQICGLFFIAILLKADFESIKATTLGVILILILFYGVANDICLFLWHYVLMWGAASQGHHPTQRSIDLVQSDGSKKWSKAERGQGSSPLHQGGGGAIL